MAKRSKSATPSKQKQEPVGLSIFQIDAEMTVIRNLLESEGGELTQEQDAYYSQLLEQAKKKADGYIGTIQYMEAQHETAKAIVKAAEVKAKRWKTIADNLRDRLAIFMANQGIKVIRPDNPAMPCAYLNAGRAKIEIDLANLSQDYVKHIPQPDKEAIQKALDAGAEIAGVVKTVGADYLTIR